NGGRSGSATRPRPCRRPGRTHRWAGKTGGSARRTGAVASVMDPQESRERFFARLRQQLRRLPPDGRTAHPGPRPRPPWRQEGDDGPLEQAAPATRLAWARRFAAEWQALGGRVYGVPRQDAVG